SALEHDEAEPAALRYEALHRRARVLVHAVELQIVLAREERIDVREQLAPPSEVVFAHLLVRIERDRGLAARRQRRDERTLHVERHRRDMKRACTEIVGGGVRGGRGDLRGVWR